MLSLVYPGTGRDAMPGGGGGGGGGGGEGRHPNIAEPQ